MYRVLSLLILLCHFKVVIIHHRLDRFFFKPTVFANIHLLPTGIELGTGELEVQSLRPLDHQVFLIEDSSPSN